MLTFFIYYFKLKIHSLLKWTEQKLQFKGLKGNFKETKIWCAQNIYVRLLYAFLIMDKICFWRKLLGKKKSNYHE